MQQIKKIGIIPVTLLAAVVFAVLFPFFVKNVKADAALQPLPCDNLKNGTRKFSSLTVTDSGYMRVFFDGSRIQVEYYSNDFDLQSRKSIDLELPIWGGFYAASDGYYITEAQNNTDENDNAEVMRVIKYDRSWNRIGAASIVGNPSLFGGEIRYPFDYGTGEMEEFGGKLYMVTAHEGYVDPYVGQGHQGFTMVEIDKESLTGTITDCDLYHSFSQYIKSDGTNMYVLEQSEGSRSTILSSVEFDEGAHRANTTEVFEYGGTRTSSQAIACFASADDLALSADNVLGIGTSIDQSLYGSVTSDTAHNIYLTVSSKTDLSNTQVKWLTGYSGGSKSFRGVKITKVNDSRFLITWEENSPDGDFEEDDLISGYTLHYLFVDGAGNVISDEFTAGAPISDCHPILNGDKIVYCASNSGMVNFYTIDANTGAFSKRTHRAFGGMVEWNYSDGVMTISGEGPLEIDTEPHYRYSVSSCDRYSVYSSSDNVWKPIREKVTKLVFSDGITSVPAEGFLWFNSLEEVDVPASVTTIGERAFAYTRSLKTITIRGMDTQIGEDINWTGSYWISDESHVIIGKILCYPDSTAEAYAKERNIRYSYLPTKIEIIGGKYYQNDVFMKNKFGFVDYDGSKFLIANGMVVTSKNGLAQDPDNTDDWYFCANGQVVTSKSGLVQYPAKTDNWFIVQNGKLDTTYSGFVDYNGGKFFVARGKLVRKDGLVQDPNDKADWYFLSKGQVQAKKTGVVIYNKAGFYVVNGKLDTTYNGNATYNGKTVKIVNGRMK